MQGLRVDNPTSNPPAKSMSQTTLVYTTIRSLECFCQFTRSATESVEAMSPNHTLACASEATLAQSRYLRHITFGHIGRNNSTPLCVSWLKKRIDAEATCRQTTQKTVMSRRFRRTASSPATRLASEVDLKCCQRPFVATLGEFCS